MIRGDNLYASGIVLVSPLEIEVLEEPGRRPRAASTVRDARTKDFVPKVQVKVIGSDNPQFISGETDLRGVFVAEGVQGLVTAVARKGTTQYAFYRGTTYVGQQRCRPSRGAGGGSRRQRPRPRGQCRLEPIARRQPQDAEQQPIRPQADRAPPAALQSAGRQEKGSGRRRLPLSILERSLSGGL